MLADPKSEALISNFAGQWLYLRELATCRRRRRSSTTTCARRSAVRPRCSSESIVREDRSIVDLLDADYTFVDERLARHYGIPNIHGSYFRRVPLDPASPRRGLLGQGSMLTVTSVATRTSPVSRGKWILENMLGTPAPVPPPGVETNLEKDPDAGEGRRRCASAWRRTARIRCARRATRSWTRSGSRWRTSTWSAAWRERDGRLPIDSAGSAGGRHALQRPRRPAAGAAVSRSDAFVTTATESCSPMRWAADSLLRHADGARDRPAGGRERLPVLVARARRRRERAVSDEDQEG